MAHGQDGCTANFLNVRNPREQIAWILVLTSLETTQRISPMRTGLSIHSKFTKCHAQRNQVRPIRQAYHLCRPPRARTLSIKEWEELQALFHLRPTRAHCPQPLQAHPQAQQQRLRLSSAPARTARHGRISPATSTQSTVDLTIILRRLRPILCSK